MARTPLYKVAETEMISRIENGVWEVGRRLPNEFELADEFKVSQGTMRRALIKLESMGLLSRKPGRGTVVALNAPRAEEASVSLTPVIVDGSGAPLPLEPFRASSGTRSASAQEKLLFGTSRLATLDRTLKSNGTRAALDHVAVPEMLVPTLSEDTPGLLKDLLIDHGHPPARIEAEASAQMTDMAQSVALSVDRHTALLAVTFVAYDGAGKVLGRQSLRVATPEARLTFT